MNAVSRKQTIYRSDPAPDTGGPRCSYWGRRTVFTLRQGSSTWNQSGCARGTSRRTGWYAALLAAGIVFALPCVAQTADPASRVPFPQNQNDSSTIPAYPPISAASQGPQGQNGATQTNAAPANSTTRQQDASSRRTQTGFERQQLPPDRPTEFQQLVEISTGQQLPIFGSSLFREPPSTFAPVDNIPVTPDYIIGPGDELRLQVWGQVNNQGSYTVDRTGAISIPQLGTVHVAGIRFADLTSFLRAQLGRVFRNFDLNVNLGQLRSIQVFVVGQARQPGSYTIGSLSTLVNALFASGGPLPQGSLRDIQLRRNGSTVVHFDLYDLLLRGDKTNDVPLQPGDVLFIPPAGPQVALTGSVNNAAIYELRGETRIDQLLALTGGRTSLAEGSTVRLERISEHTSRSVVEMDLSASPDLALEAGDIVIVNSIVDRFRNAVTLRGNVANPGRYRWHAGMRVTDLLPDRDALLTRNYWIKRNQLGREPVDFIPAPASNTSGRTNLSSTTGAVNGTDVSQGGAGERAAGLSTSTQAEGTPARGTTSASGGGNAVAAAALAGSDTAFPVRNDVVLSAPDIDWSYAVIERQEADLKTTLLPFNLGRAVLDGDASQNLLLQPNDVVTIFSTADIRVPSTQQTRFVRLEGEFSSAGVYSVRPGETLRQLLARAGGFTPDAYLYASEFTRQSTRRVERQRLKDYADQLEARVSAETAGNSARAITDRDAAAAQDSAASARAAITRLRQLDPIGRIVLQLKPDSRGIDSVPDLALEDGDRFIVPKVPSNVYVEGEVYSANAFVFERGQRTARYLRLAGGPNREADRSRAFILRADGSVYSRQYGNLASAHIFPGDTIVVPPTINKRAILRDLVDISNIIGGFGVGVAAINVLK